MATRAVDIPAAAARLRHGDRFADDARRVPRLLPTWSLDHEPEGWPVPVRSNRRTFLDAIERLKEAGIIPVPLSLP